MARQETSRLYVTSMCLRVGGKQENQTAMRDTPVTPSCLRSVKMDGSATQRLKPGDFQHFRFHPGDVVNPYDAENSKLVTFSSNKSLFFPFWVANGLSLATLLGYVM